VINASSKRKGSSDEVESDFSETNEPVSDEDKEVTLVKVIVSSSTYTKLNLALLIAESTKELKLLMLSLWNVTKETLPKPESKVTIEPIPESTKLAWTPKPTKAWFKTPLDEILALSLEKYSETKESSSLLSITVTKDSSDEVESDFSELDELPSEETKISLLLFGLPLPPLLPKGEGLSPPKIDYLL